MSELVTGEAVALELRPAKLPSRMLAVLLDLCAAVGVYLVVTVVLMASASSMDDAALAALAVASFLLVLVGGPIAVETLSHGRSLGKLACGLRVVRDDGGPVRFRHALVRGAVGVVEVLLTVGTIACLASLVSARGRRVGDVLAGTLVVRERVPAGRSGWVPAPPPWLVGRFADLDLSGVPDGLWLAVRQYLTRMGQLAPEVSQAMAGRLAEDLVAHTGAPAPYGVPAAAYLAAVLHERQARDARRTWAAGPGAAGPGSPGSGPPAAPGTPGTPGVPRSGTPGSGPWAPAGAPAPGRTAGGASAAGYGGRPAAQSTGGGPGPQHAGGAAPPTGFVPPA